MRIVTKVRLINACSMVLLSLGILAAVRLLIRRELLQQA